LRYEIQIDSSSSNHDTFTCQISAKNTLNQDEHHNSWGSTMTIEELLSEYAEPLSQVDSLYQNVLAFIGGGTFSTWGSPSFSLHSIVSASVDFARPARTRVQLRSAIPRGCETLRDYRRSAFRPSRRWLRSFTTLWRGSANIIAMKRAPSEAFRGSVTASRVKTSSYRRQDSHANDRISLPSESSRNASSPSFEVTVRSLAGTVRPKDNVVQDASAFHRGLPRTAHPSRDDRVFETSDRQESGV